MSSALPATSSSQRRDVYGVVAEVIVASIRSSRIPLFDVGAPYALGCLESHVNACCTAIVQVRSLRQASMNPFDILIRREDEEPPSAEIIGDALIIDCRRCRLAPVPGTSECISCMVASMCRAGSADRVVLRTGRDMEISGKAGRILKEAASLRRWSIPAEAPPARCRGCAVSRHEVMSRAWDRFPDPVEPSVKASLVRDVPARDGCAECASGTMKALEHMERGVGSLMASMKGGRRRSRASLSRSCSPDAPSASCSRRPTRI